MWSLDTLRSRKGVSIIYDGECPFCRNYVRVVRLRNAVGPVELVDARQHPTIVAELTASGYNIDEGMVFISNGKLWHADDAVHHIALLSSQSDILNKINRSLMGNRPLAAVIYPVLRTGRRLTLRLLRRRPILKS